MQIAITGIGVVSALGMGVEDHRKHLLEGRSALGQPKVLSTSHREWPVGEVAWTNEQLCSMLHLPNRPITRNVLLGLCALQEAIHSAHIPLSSLANISLVNGTTVGGMDLTEQYFASWSTSLDCLEECLPQHEADYTSQYLVRHFGLASAHTVSTACSSALNALIHGVEILRTGQSTCVIVGGTEALTKFHLNGFASLGILSHSVCQPFEEQRDGINLGEGAAYLVLEEATSAHARKADVYGYIAGYGNSCDAYHQTASSPEGDGAFDAMMQAIQLAHIAPSNIAYINAHGTGTQNNDASELRAIQRVFGNHIPNVESTKSLTGHTTSASGSIEAILTLERMKQHGYTYALSNAFGFGGNDSSVLLSTQTVDLPSVPAKGCWLSPVVQSSTLSDYKPYIPAIQARRMTPMLRQLIVAAKEMLTAVGIVSPSAIVVGTRWGGMIPTMALLNHMQENGENDGSPSQFMNSTHNTPAGTLARFFQCKGYNSTIVSSVSPFDAAMKDAQLLLATSDVKNVLVCAYDEIETTWSEWTRQVGIQTDSGVKVQLIVKE